MKAKYGKTMSHGKKHNGSKGGIPHSPASEMGSTGGMSGGSHGSMSSGKKLVKKARRGK